VPATDSTCAAIIPLARGRLASRTIAVHRRDLPRVSSRRCGGDSMTIETDEKLAIDFLGCEASEHDGVVKFSYVEPGSDREKECLAALCRLLRGREPISTGLRWRLATLFDADAEVEARQLVFVRRRGGPHEPSDAKSVMIASDVAAELSAGHKLESAIAAAVQRYGVSRPTVQRAWKAHRAAYEKQR
jgi:hypothetical protein